MKAKMTFKEEMKAIWKSCQHPDEVDTSEQNFEEWQPTSKKDNKAIVVCVAILSGIAIFMCIL